MLDFLQDFMHRLFKSDVHPFYSSNEVMPTNLPSGPLLKAPDSGLLLVLKSSMDLACILQPVVLQSLVFFYAPH